MSISFKRSHSSSNRGFTLIELLTVIAIMVVVTTVLLIRQSQFDSSTVLRSLAFSVGLSLRQAQIYGTSVYGTTTTQTNCQGGSYQNGVCFASAYGIHVSSGSTYILYADLNPANGKYDAGEDIKDFNFSPGYTISTACADLSGAAYCTGPCPTTIPFGAATCNASTPTWVDIVFHRPNPEACITESAGPFCTTGTSNSYSAAYIQISNGTATRGVTITSTGEITVGAPGT